AYTASFDTRAFTLHKQPTTLTLSPAAVTMQEGTSASVQATLLDSFDASVRHKSVLFVIRDENDDIRFSRVLITDFRGQTTLSLDQVNLPAGEYTLHAFFGGDSPIAGLDLADARYGLSSATVTVTVTPVPSSG